MRKIIRHLVGIIPAAGQPLDYNFFFNDNMIPIGNNFLAIERAVAECAHVGCKTIWIVLPKFVEPFIRERLGDRVFCPFRYTPIPLYYICLHPKDMNKRDSIPWSIIYGAEVVKRFAKKFSTSLIPEKFYVSFPFGVYPNRKIPLDIRTVLTLSQSRVILEGFDHYEGKMVDATSGGFLGFSFFPEEIGPLKLKFIRSATGQKMKGGSPQNPTKLLPVEEWYSGRWLTVKDLLEDFPLGNNVQRVFIKTYAGIENWDKYRFYLSRKWAKFIKKPDCLRTSYQTTKIGFDPSGKKEYNYD